MDESKYTDGFIWSVGPVFNSSEKRLARALLLLANFGKEGRPEPITPGMLIFVEGITQGDERCCT